MVGLTLLFSWLVVPYVMSIWHDHDVVEGISVLFSAFLNILIIFDGLHLLLELQTIWIPGDGL